LLGNNQENKVVAIKDQVKGKGGKLDGSQKIELNLGQIKGGLWSKKRGGGAGGEKWRQSRKI